MVGRLPVKEMDYTIIVGCGEDGQRAGPGPQDDTWMVLVFFHSRSFPPFQLPITDPRSWFYAKSTARFISRDLRGRGCEVGAGHSAL